MSSYFAVDAWGAWFLFALFAAILVWEEVWDLPHSAAFSGWLLLLITAGAVICSALFERRLWCRHLCPIGGMNSLFAKMSMTELRARQGICSGDQGLKCTCFIISQNAGHASCTVLIVLCFVI